MTKTEFSILKSSLSIATIVVPVIYNHIAEKRAEKKRLIVENIFIVYETPSK